MVNRLKNYLSSRALAEPFLNPSENQVNSGNLGMSIRHLIQGMRYLITANNNLPSLAFNSKQKARRQ